LTDWHDEYRKRIDNIEAREEAAMVSEERMVAVSKLRADQWADVLPATDEEEFQQLKEDIEEKGLLSSLVVTNNKDVVDGHRRYRAAVELGFETVSVKNMNFADGDAVKEFMLSNQLTRRNLPPEERRRLIGTWYNLRKKKPCRPEKSEDKVPETSTFSPPEKTADKIAKEQKVSSATVRAAAKEVSFLDTHPEFKADKTQSDILELQKLDKQFRKDFGDDITDELYTRAPKVAKAHGCDRMTAKEFGKAQRLMLEGWANTPVEALDAVFAVTEDGRTFADDCLNPPLVDGAGAEDETKEESHAAVPAEDTAIEKLDTVKVVLDGIAYMIVAEEHDIEDPIVKELLQLYRTIFGEEMISDEVRNSLVA